MNTVSVLLVAAVTISTEIALTPIVVTMLSGLIIPIAVGIVTKSAAAPQVKQVVTIVLAGVAALITSSTLADGSAVFSLETLLLAGFTWLVAIASYLGVYRPLNLNDHTLPNSGLGTVVEATGFEKG
jgi:hypothetical protein